MQELAGGRWFKRSDKNVRPAAPPAQPQASRRKHPVTSPATRRPALPQATLPPRLAYE